jgi:CBS domain-containing protein
MMHTIGQLLEAKGKDIWSISPSATVFEALRIMAKKDIGALLVVDKEKLVGIFSERDYVQKVILKGKSSKETNVGELMTTDVFYIDPKNTLHECMAIMTAKHIRHMPVLENNQLIGMLTLGDVVKQIISEQEFTIRELEVMLNNVTQAVGIIDRIYFAFEGRLALCFLSTQKKQRIYSRNSAHLWKQISIPMKRNIAVR